MSAVISRDHRYARHIASDARLDELLRGLLRDRRCVFVAGQPATGKTLLVREAARLSVEAGRTVHLIRWDVARLAFDTPEILARYPEVGGVTHAIIRVAVGLWARGAILRWHRAHRDPRDVLIGETPLAGERLMELARPRDDEAEPLLAGDATCFIVPVPDRALRRAIEEARARDVADERDLGSAAPAVVRAHWAELERIADALGIARRREDGGYDPELYAAVYERVLRHRHVVVARMTDLRDAPAVVDALAIVPAAAEVDLAIGEAESIPREALERTTSEWYRL